MQRHGKRVRCLSTFALTNSLEFDESTGKQGPIAHKLMYIDPVILDDPGHPSFSQASGALLFHLLSKLSSDHIASIWPSGLLLTLTNPTT